MRLTAISLAVFLLAGSAGNAAVPGASLSYDWATQWSTKKLDAVIALYAPAPVFLPTSHTRWTGTAAIRKNFSALLAQFNPDIRLHSVRSESSGDLAYDSGSYVETIAPVKGGTIMHFQGDYLFVFQRQKNGEWKILEQTFTIYDSAKL
jgi:ketosteroid isomerase-like protein